MEKKMNAITPSDTSVIELDDSISEEDFNEPDSTQVKAEQSEVLGGQSYAEVVEDPFDLLASLSMPNLASMSDFDFDNETQVVTNEADGYQDELDVSDLLELKEPEVGVVEQNEGEKPCRGPESIPDNHRFLNKWLFEFVVDDPKSVRCNLCDRVFSKHNKGRHAMKRSHISLWNVFKKKMDQKDKSDEVTDHEDVKPCLGENFGWDSLQGIHPWITSCPTDPSEAYCTLCETVVVQGSSVIKRRLHEKTYAHICAYDEKRRSEMEAGSNKEMDDSGEHDGRATDYDKNEQLQNSEGSSYDEKDSDDEDYESEASSKKAQKRKKKAKGKSLLYRGTEDWFARYPWIKEYKRDPNYYECIYCKVVMKRKNLRPYKHQETIRHKTARREATLKFLEERRKASSNTDAEYPWFVDLGPTAAMMYCLYCSRYISKRKSKKEHQTSQRHCEAAERDKASKIPPHPKNPKPESNSTAPLDSAKTSLGSPLNELTLKWQRKCKEYRKLYPFISFQKIALDGSGCFVLCSPCDRQLKVRSLSHISKHALGAVHQGKVNEKKKIQQQRLLQQTKNIENLTHNTGDKCTPAKQSGEGHDAAILKGESEGKRKKKYLWTAVFEEFPFLEPEKKPTRTSSIFIEHSKPTRLFCTYCAKSFVVYCYAHVKAHCTSSSHEKAVSSQMPDSHANKPQKDGNPGTETNQNDDGKQKAVEEDATSTPRRESSASFTVDSTTSTQQSQELPNSYAASPATSATPDPIDLFFDSLRSTMKSLPCDLASEGKLKMMEILFNLEMRAFKRRQPEGERDAEVRTSSSSCVEPQNEMGVQMSQRNPTADIRSLLKPPNQRKQGFREQGTASTVTIPRISLMTQSHSASSPDNSTQPNVQNNPRSNLPQAPYSSSTAVRRPSSNHQDVERGTADRKVRRMSLSTQQPQSTTKNNHPKTNAFYQNHDHQYYQGSSYVQQAPNRPSQVPNGSTNVNSTTRNRSPVQNMQASPKDYEIIHVISDSGTAIITLNDVE